MTKGAAMMIRAIFETTGVDLLAEDFQKYSEFADVMRYIQTEISITLASELLGKLLFLQEKYKLERDCKETHEKILKGL